MDVYENKCSCRSIDEFATTCEKRVPHLAAFPGPPMLCVRRGAPEAFTPGGWPDPEEISHARTRAAERAAVVTAIPDARHHHAHGVVESVVQRPRRAQERDAGDGGREQGGAEPRQNQILKRWSV